MCVFSSPCQRQSEVLSSLGVRRPSSVVCLLFTFHILIFSSETPLSNLSGSSYGMAFLKIAHFALSINKYGRHRKLLFLIGRFWKIFSSETAWTNKPKLGMKCLRKVLDKKGWRRSDPLTNMVVTDNSCFWLVDF